MLISLRLILQEYEAASGEMTVSITDGHGVSRILIEQPFPDNPVLKSHSPLFLITMHPYVQFTSFDNLVCQYHAHSHPYSVVYPLRLGERVSEELIMYLIIFTKTLEIKEWLTHTFTCTSDHVYFLEDFFPACTRIFANSGAYR